MKTDYYKSRRTLSESVKLDGLGLHSGESTSVELIPAEAGEGLVFERIDCNPSVTIEADADSIVDTERNTVIGADGTELQLVEHLLSSLYGLGVTDLKIQVDGPELPALDGSAAGYVEAIDEAGLDELGETRELHQVEEPVSVQLGESSLVVLPDPNPSIDYTISYENPGIGDQFYTVDLTPDRYRDDIGPARTYGFKEEVEELLEADLAQGGSLDNALVVDEEGDFLGSGPQFENEFARHKILDLLGDLALTGEFIVGKIIGVKGSHELNAGLVKELSDSIPDPAPAEPDTSGTSSVSSPPLDVSDIREVLPHRYPFLLVDRIVSIDYEESRAVGYKNVTINEEYFQGHFPDDPVMPGVLVIEAMAQLGAACILRKPEYDGKNSYFMGLDNVKWRKPVRPGDRVYFEIEGKRMRSKYGVVEGEARVDGELAAEGVYKFAIVDQGQQ
ncbi:MAG: UDP-3-O-acyl-N-acetylglucosamine deacetylase [bacterium]